MSERLLKWLEENSFGPQDVVGKKIVIYSNEGVGKTVLACRLGRRNLIITNESGYDSLHNHPELNKAWKAIPFKGWSSTCEILPLVENKQFCHDDGEPFDNIIFDTMSGEINQEIRKIVADGIATDKGKVSKETAGRPDYLVSEQRIEKVMEVIAQLRRCTVTMLFHLRTGDPLTPGDNTRPDAHAAAFKAVNKFTSVSAYLFMRDGKRMLQVMPGNGVSAKTRLHFPKPIVTDDEFVAHIEQWKAGSPNV